MHKNRVNVFFRLFLLLAVPALVFSGCGNFSQTYVPPSIVFDSPGNAIVYAPGTPSVTIKGHLVPGKDDDGNTVGIQSLSVNNDFPVTISYDPATYAFEYVFALDQTGIFSTCTFNVVDANNISAQNRISFSMGASSKVGDPGVQDDSLSMLLTQSVMDTLSSVIGTVINRIKYDLVYGYDDPTYGSGTPDPLLGGTKLLPMELDLGDLLGGIGSLLGSMVIDHNDEVGTRRQGFINFGNVSLGIDLQDGDTIGATLIISPEAGVNPRDNSASALFVQGYHRGELGITRTHFTLMADYVAVQNLKLKLKVNSENKIVADIDFSDCEIDFYDAQLEYGLLTIPDWLMNAVMELVKVVIKSIPLGDITIMDASGLGMGIGNLDLSLWPMQTDPIFSSTADKMWINLGVGMDLADWGQALNPGADRFITTPGDVLPEIDLAGDENVVMALSDDFMNMAAMMLVQSKMLQGLDMSEKILEDMGAMALYNQDLVIKAYIGTPPVFDFSADYEKDGEYLPFGLLRIANLVLDIQNLKLTPISTPMNARVSVDADAVLDIYLSEDMRKLQAKANADLSTVDLKLLYCTDVNAGIASSFVSFAIKAAVTVLDKTLSITIDQDIPAIELYGMSPKVELVGNDFLNNYLITRLLLSIE